MIDKDPRRLAREAAEHAANARRYADRATRAVWISLVLILIALALANVLFRD